MSVTIKHRGDTAANWVAANPVLAVREMGLELDTQRFKVGDGAAWNSLGYWGGQTQNYLVGQAITWTISTLPSSEWLWADGSEITTAHGQLRDLYIADGYPHGQANGNPLLPKINGRTIIAPDNMGGTSANVVVDAQADVLGGVGGAEQVALTSANNGPHAHTFTTRTGSGAGDRQATRNSGSYVTSTTTSSGSGTPHDNMQPWIALPQIIYGGP